jgi:hypothetical protein
VSLQGSRKSRLRGLFSLPLYTSLGAEPRPLVMYTHVVLRNRSRRRNHSDSCVAVQPWRVIANWKLWGTEVFSAYPDHGGVNWRVVLFKAWRATPSYVTARYFLIAPIYMSVSHCRNLGQTPHFCSCGSTIQFA